MSTDAIEPLGIQGDPIRKISVMSQVDGQLGPSSQFSQHLFLDIYLETFKSLNKI